MHSIVKIAGFAVALTSLTAMGQPTFASTRDGKITRSERVEYRRGELMNEAGARRVFQRLREGASKACSDDIYSRRGREFQECRDGALAEAVKKIGSPQLTAVAAPATPTKLARR